jgi:hypothetical protein
MSLKVCKICFIEKQIDDFEKRQNSWRSECKKCRAQKKQQNAKEKSALIDRELVSKPLCNQCGLTFPEVMFAWRSDVAKGGWKSICNKCYNVKGYSEKSRAKHREANETEYLAKNAATHLAWAKRNPDKVDIQLQLVKTDPERRWKALLTYLRHKHGDKWEKHIELDGQETFIKRLQEPCHYCGINPSANDDKLNGLDRVDPKGIYSVANTVPCCGVCNSMKLIYSVDQFIDGIRKIFYNCKLEHQVHDEPLLCAFGKTYNRMNKGVKDKTCYLSHDEKLQLLASPCYLCGRSPAFGIDRVDANSTYVKDNCKGCCSQCNYMKKDWELQPFQGHVSRIYNYTKTWVLLDTSDQLVGQNGPRTPISVAFDDVQLIFPSIAILDNILGVSKDKIVRVIQKGGIYLGCIWSNASVQDYHKQCMDYGTVYEKLKSLCISKRS